MKLRVIRFSQRDSKWANEKLGTSSVTIDLYGCAIASLAMVEKYFGFDTDPGRLNTLCAEKGVYAQRNLMQWWQVQKVNEFVTLKDWIDCVTTPAPIDKIKSALDSGLPCILHVDLNPNEPGPDHFIVCIGYTEDGHLLCYDPWYDNEDAIFFDARYKDPVKYIFRILIFNGPVPQPEAPKPDIAGLNQQIDTLKGQLDDIKDTLRPAGVVIGNDVSDITKSIVELVSIKNQYNNHLKQDEVNLEKPDKAHEGFNFNRAWKINGFLIEFWKKEVK